RGARVARSAEVVPAGAAVHRDPRPVDVVRALVPANDRAPEMLVDVVGQGGGTDRANRRLHEGALTQALRVEQDLEPRSGLRTRVVVVDSNAALRTVVDALRRAGHLPQHALSVRDRVVDLQEHVVTGSV